MYTCQKHGIGQLGNLLYLKVPSGILMT